MGNLEYSKKPTIPLEKMKSLTTAELSAYASSIGWPELVKEDGVLNEEEFQKFQTDERFSFSEDYFSAMKKIFG